MLPSDNYPRNEHETFTAPLGEVQPRLETLTIEDLGHLYGQAEVASTPNYYKTVVEVARSAKPEVDIKPESVLLTRYANNLQALREMYLRQSDKETVLTSPDAPIFNELADKMFGKELRKRLVDPLFGKYRPIELRDLIERESVVGGKLFGESQPNETIKFYNLDQNSWYFYHELSSGTNPPTSSTIHYLIHSDEILRSRLDTEVLEEKLFVPLTSSGTDDELGNFMLATKMYYERVLSQVYGRDPQTGEKLQ